MTELDHYKEIARYVSAKYNSPRQIVSSPFGGYTICSMTQKTNCERVWTTEDIEEPQKTPAQIEMCERIAKMKNELNLFKEEKDV
jgi:hypothetical protein